MSANRRLPETVELCVVGAGPTGIAALVEAHRLGIAAIALEAGTSALAAIAAHPERLVYLSAASHFEIAGLPLDCAHPQHCTREDVLHYFGRVITWGRLRIHTSSSCVDLQPRSGYINVTAKTPCGTEQIRATNVLVTSWYAPRLWESRGSVAEDAPRVISSVRSPIGTVNDRVAVVGGGLSGYEQALLLMSVGNSITLVLRGSPRAIHFEREFVHLLQHTQSSLETMVEAISPESGGIRLTRRGRETFIPCDTVVYAAGSELEERMLGIMCRAGILDEPTAGQLRAAPTFEDAARAELAIPKESQAEWVARARPDLWKYAFEGVRGVRFAGGILHGAGQHAGVGVSIATARLPVRAIAGMAPPMWRPPLPVALLDIPAVLRAASSAADVELLRLIYPLRVSSWSRTWRLRPVQDVRTTDISSKELSAEEMEVLDLADGARTVGDIVSSDTRWCIVDAAIESILRVLWYHHALTWSPPSTGMPRQT